MLVSIVAADWSYYPTQEVEIDEDLAEKWVRVGHAEYVKTPKGGVKNGSAKVDNSTSGGTVTSE